MAALLIVEATVVRTVAAATRYAAGCLLGVVVAVPAALYVEPAMVGLGLVVFASVPLARHELLGHQGLHLPTTALITFALVRGRHPAELVSHLAEITLGIAFGLACSALLFPAVRVRSAERSVERLRTLLARHLDGLADAVARRERPRNVLGSGWERELDAALAQARTAVDEAHESVRWNVRPTARRRRWHLDRRVMRTLADVERQVCAAGRLLDTRPAVSRPGARAGRCRRRRFRRAVRTIAAHDGPVRLRVPGRAPPSRAACRPARPRPPRRTRPRSPVDRDEDRHLVQHLDAVLCCLTTSVPTPTRQHRVLSPLRPSQRR
ncbi:hypothetical protein O1M54_48195 [Streptomyces diastatochromogenes]|nr:hypothetical protein [Streptomyces diastatochromogenes]